MQRTFLLCVRIIAIADCADMGEIGYAAGERHRCVEAEKTEFHHFPESVFHHIRTCYGSDCDAIHRCFSLARLYGAKMYVDELIPTVGQLEDDLLDFVYRGKGKKNSDADKISRKYAELVARPEQDKIYAAHTDGSCCAFKAQRISFWRKSLMGMSSDKRLSALSELKNSDCIGYVILIKAGSVKNQPDRIRWIVYESALDGRSALRGVMPQPAVYSFRVGSCIRKLSGRLYCQQNGRTSVCAHVAIRSMLSALLPEHDISYRRISDLAKYSGGPMTIAQIRRVFRTLGFTVHDWVCDNRKRNGKIPLYHCLYSGVESGAGSLLGFNIRNHTSEGTDSSKREQHIIPVFGHTFNKHMWVNEASGYYFQSGLKNPKSFLSDNWVSTFIAHDDNVGPNVYIPRFYVEQFALSSVISVIPRKADLHGRCYRAGVVAERTAVAWLQDDVLRHLQEWKGYYEDNPWLDCLREALASGVSDPETSIARVVLRSVFISRDQYRRQLMQDRDRNGNIESREVVAGIVGKLPEELWMVEFSLPHLFPVNERKLGEILLDANPHRKKRTRGVVLIRLPTRYLLPESKCKVRNRLSAVDCYEQPSQIDSHMPCFVFSGARRVK